MSTNTAIRGVRKVSLVTDAGKGLTRRTAIRSRMDAVVKPRVVHKQEVSTQRRVVAGRANRGARTVVR